MSAKAYNSTVAARTRAAMQILESPELLEGFVEMGGLDRDLVGIRDAGLEAEAAYIGRSAAKSEGKGATANVWMSFAEVQKEYKSLMNVVNIVTSEAIRNSEPPEIVTRLKGILANETQVTVSVVEEKKKDGISETKRKVKKSDAQEAIRTEIAKDAAQLLTFTEIHPKLAERRVSLDRIRALKQKTDELAGLLAERASAKGEGKSSTKVTHDAVSRQREMWAGAYRILAALGRRDERVRSMLKDAKR
ncbi:MAG: hypothetical protein JXR76_14665 [Deltaproteobacteria bacterium]|nr:hypothetical protein [Deltaproteobacteria bacterium]